MALLFPVTSPSDMERGDTICTDHASMQMAKVTKVHADTAFYCSAHPSGGLLQLA